MSTSVYPGQLDSFPDPSPSTSQDDPVLGLSPRLTALNDAMEAVQGTLGATPQGNAATVAARLAALDTTVAGLGTGGGGGTSAPAANVPLFIRKVPPASGTGDGTWPARPTTDGNIMVFWDGAPNADGSGPPTVTTGTGGMRPGDKWLSHP